MPRYKLIDYVHPTSGELARLILQFKGIEFEDEKVDSPDKIYEAEEASPFGILPVLLVDGTVVCQNQGISRYLAREFDLVGESNEEAAVADMIMDSIGKMFTKLRGSEMSKLDIKEQMKIAKQMLEEDVPRFLDKFEIFLSRSKVSSGYFASEKLTWCDLGMGLTLAGMQIRQPKILEKHPRLKAFVDKVTSNPIVEDFIYTELAQSAIIRKNSLS